MASLTGKGKPPVLPDCDQLDDLHNPPGKRPAVYLYEYKSSWAPLPGHCKILCIECCARIRLASQQPGADHDLTPPPTRIKVLRDPNTLDLAI